MSGERLKRELLTRRVSLKGESQWMVNEYLKSLAWSASFGSTKGWYLLSHLSPEAKKAAWTYSPQDVKDRLRTIALER